jgi:hypothetical protein
VFQAHLLKSAQILRAAESRVTIDNVLEMLANRMTGKSALHSNLRERFNFADELLYFALTIKRLSTPRPTEVSPCGEHLSCRSKPIEGPFVPIGILDRRTREYAAQTLRHGLQIPLNPHIECSVVNPSRLLLVDFFETRCYSCFNGTLAQNFCTERMDRSDVRFFQPCKGFFKIAILDGIRRSGSRFIEFNAKAQPEFTGGFSRERDCDKTIYRSPSCTEDADDPADQFGSLSGTCGGFDDQALIERFTDPLSRDVIVH